MVIIVTIPSDKASLSSSSTVFIGLGLLFVNALTTCLLKLSRAISVYPCMPMSRGSFLRSPALPLRRSNTCPALRCHWPTLALQRLQG